MKRTRLSLDLDAPAKERLEALQSRLGASSMTDVIRRALTPLDVLTEDPKAKIQVTHHGQTETIRLL